MNLKSPYPMDKDINKKGKKINNLEAIMNQMSQNCLHTCDKRLLFSFIEKFQGIFDYICNIKEVEEDEIISIMDKLSMKHMQYDI